MKRAILAMAAVCSFGVLAWAAGRSADTLNDKCPLSGKDVANATSDVEVKLCCDKCVAAYEKDPAKVLGKVTKLPNDKCPVSGKAVGEAKVTASIGFCCNNCKGKFDEAPEKHLGKVKAKKK
ncbi:MAG TPA: hypothetical protein VEJ18_11420 [Planctomycetota bacterium]|nr:hypothetical protein [Planctomycetota bacterium]